MSYPNLLHHLIISVGTVRKALSVGFVGESRQSGQIYIVDAQLEGLQGGYVRNWVIMWACSFTSMKTGVLILGRP